MDKPKNSGGIYARMKSLQQALLDAMPDLLWVDIANNFTTRLVSKPMASCHVDISEYFSGAPFKSHNTDRIKITLSPTNYYFGQARRIRPRCRIIIESELKAGFDMKKLCATIQAYIKRCDVYEQADIDRQAFNDKREAIYNQLAPLIKGIPMASLEVPNLEEVIICYKIRIPTSHAEKICESICNLEREIHPYKLD